MKKNKKTFNMDGWKNILTGMGIRGKDRRTSSFIQWNQMTEVDADELYSSSDVAGKIVDEIVEESFREGYTLTAKSLTDEINKKIVDEEKRLCVDKNLQEAWKYARIYGGGVIIPVPSKIEDLEKRMNINSIVAIESLLVITRWELVAGEIESDIRSPNFGKPIDYMISPRSGRGVSNQKVHHSWLISFDGSFLPRRKFVENNYWHDSVLNKCKNAIRDYDSALSAVSTTLDDFSVAVMKMEGLSQKIAQDRDDLIVRRFEIANLTRSVAKMIVLDAEKETYEYQDRQLSGVADAVKLISGRLVVASGMPHTKILGESPEGSQATGNSTTKDWYDTVRSKQENYLDPRLIALWNVIFSASKGPTGGKVPEGLQAKYAPLWQEPEGEQAKTRETQSKTDVAYINAGVLDPAEVAVARFGNEEYSTDTKLMSKRSMSPEGPEPKPEQPKNPKEPKEPTPKE